MVAQALLDLADLPGEGDCPFVGRGYSESEHFFANEGYDEPSDARPT
jgi:hypothetical protein